MGEVLGGIALRHESAQDVAVLGHVGYGLRPSVRGRSLGEDYRTLRRRSGPNRHDRPGSSRTLHHRALLASSDRLPHHPHINEDGVLLVGFLGAVKFKTIAPVEALGPFVGLFDPENARVGAEGGVQEALP